MHDYYAKGLPCNLPLMNDVGFEKLKNGGIDMVDKNPVTPQNKEEQFWYVKGTILYTLKDGNRHRYRLVSRGVPASDMQDAADDVLEGIPQLLFKMKGVEIVDACWESEPEVSSFDPYIDR